MKVIVPFSKIALYGFLVSIFFAFCCKAQTPRKHDVIIKRDSVRIEAFILEVDENVVKYKRQSDPEGPIFYLNKSEIASILYGNGETERISTPAAQYFEEITVQPVVPYKPESREKVEAARRPDNTNRLQANYKLYVKKASTYKTMSIIGGSVGVLFTVVGIATVSDAVRKYNNLQMSYNSYENKVAGGTLLVMTGLGAGIPLTIIGLVKRKNYTKKALRVQEELRRGKDLTLFPGYNPINQSGYLGLRLSF